MPGAVRRSLVLPWRFPWRLRRNPAKELTPRAGPGPMEARAAPTLLRFKPPVMMAFPPRRLRTVVSVFGLLLLFLSSTTRGTPPVELRFTPTATEGNPFSREIWARVETPSERIMELPAYYRGGGQWAVRTRAAERGNYRLQSVSEFVADISRPLNFEAEDRGRFRVRDEDESGGFISIDRRSGQRFVDARGNLYTPLGGNLPWATEGRDPVDYYRAAFADFQRVGFNWSRVWMCDWGQTNLDWVDPAHGEQPELGQLDLDVARRLDRIINAAEDFGVRLQLVLQHHGQFTTYNNSDWAENPWNAANEDGFLEDPADFFTDATARRLTRDKYRYIVARWGYSPAILAWELFNEVMWTNARRGDAAANTAVADWHTEMARLIRRYDVHGHLVTTSDDDLSHELWSAMDYYQPHLYATNMILGLQSLALSDRAIDRPVFYGEMGDDNMVGLSSEQRASGFVHPILAWSGLFGRATAPAQMWYVETLRANDRWPEVAALAGFVEASGILRQALPRIEHPLVLDGATTSLRIGPGHYWHRGANPTIDLPTDGTEPPELIEFRRILDSAAKPDTAFPTAMTLRLHSPAATNARLTVASIAPRGGSLRIAIDGQVVANTTWPAVATGRPVPRDVVFDFRLGYGTHEITLENPHGPDWIDLAGLDLGLPVPALTAVARRSPDRIVLWVRHRDNLLSPDFDDELTPTAATVQLNDVAPGNWAINWWDPIAGRRGEPMTLRHRGGPLRIKTPEILRHAGAWLERLPEDR